MIRVCVLLTILWTCAACQQVLAQVDTTLPAQSATRAVLPYAATRTPHAIEPTAATESVSSAPTPTFFPAVETTPEAGDSTVIGYSAEGRGLVARRFGSGTRALLLIGGIHGGWEANTVALMEALIDHFAAAPQDVPPGAAVIIVADANPDGSEYGQIPRGRFNGNGVDLNRNWSCDWSSDAYWRQERVSAGLRPMSEPETQALQAFMLEVRPAAVLSYHSAANGVYAGECDGDHGSAALAAVFGEAAGYPSESSFASYPVTGTLPDWADEQGIPAADVELANHDDPEYERNLRGVLAVLVWLAEAP